MVQESRLRFEFAANRLFEYGIQPPLLRFTVAPLRVWILMFLNSCRKWNMELPGVNRCQNARLVVSCRAGSSGLCCN